MVRLQAFLVESKSNGPGPEAAKELQTTTLHHTTLTVFDCGCSLYDMLCYFYGRLTGLFLSRPQNIFPKRLRDHRDVLLEPVLN